MKKILLILPLILLAAAGCKELSRDLNPTDPESSSYIGVTFYGEAGEFMDVAELAGRDSAVYVVDSSGSRLHKYTLEGELLWKTDTAGLFSTPTGLATDANYMYIVDKSSVVGNYNFKVFDYVPDIQSAMSFLTPTAIDYVATDGANVYLAVSEPAVIYKYNIDPGNPTLPDPVNFDWSTAVSANVSKISCIKVLGDGRIAVNDPVAKAIKIFNNNGTFDRTLYHAKEATGFCLHGAWLVIPHPGGVTEIDYNGNVQFEWGYYGNGNGKITHACPCVYSNERYFFGNGSTMKVFGK